jgi:hypothetical protein
MREMVKWLASLTDEQMDFLYKRFPVKMKGVEIGIEYIKKETDKIRRQKNDKV